MDSKVIMKSRLAGFVKERRRALGLSQRGLAKKAHISHSVVNKIEAGDLNLKPRTDTLESLADALGVPLSRVMDEYQGTRSKEVNADPLLALIEDLTPKQRKLLLSIAKLLIEEEL